MATARPVMEPRSSNVTEDRNAEEMGKGEEKPNSVPFHNLFSFVDSTDVLLMVIGTVGAVRNGLGMSLMTILFGQLFNSFGKTLQANVIRVLSKLCLKFVYLAEGDEKDSVFHRKWKTCEDRPKKERETRWRVESRESTASERKPPPTH